MAPVIAEFDFGAGDKRIELHIVAVEETPGKAGRREVAGPMETPEAEVGKGRRSERPASVTTDIEARPVVKPCHWRCGCGLHCRQIGRGSGGRERERG